MKNSSERRISKSLGALALIASMSLVGFGIQSSGAETVKSHALGSQYYCDPHDKSADDLLHVGPTVNALANVITEIRRGQPVEVMSRPVELKVGEGSESNGKGLPIVFKVHGFNCLGFTEGTALIQLPTISPYVEAQRDYDEIPEPAGDKNVPLVDATQVAGELGVIETQSGLTAGFSYNKFSSSACAISSCPQPNKQESF